MNSQLTLRLEKEKFVFDSLVEENNIFEARAHDIANIISYDKEHYKDVNIETLIRAAEIADIIKVNDNK